MRVKMEMKKCLSYIESSYTWKTVFEDPFEYDKNF